MIKYNLDVTSVPTLSNNKAKQVIILCHGYGGDGKDISGLAINWQRFLPDAIFLCPNAPEVCADNPGGYQWFDMTSENEEMMLEKSLAAAEKLNTFLDQVVNNFQLKSSNHIFIAEHEIFGRTQKHRYRRKKRSEAFAKLVMHRQARL